MPVERDAGKRFFQIANGDFTGYQVSELLAGFVDNYSIGARVASSVPATTR